MRTSGLFVAFLICAAVPAIPQQSAKPLLEHTFENGENGWVGFGPDAQVRAVADPKAKSGKSVLVLEYRIEPKQIGMAALPAMNGELAGMKTMRFRLQTDGPTSVAVVLSETKPDGGDYTAVVWSPGGAWLEIELALADFTLNDGPNDPKDADGKLDVDQLQGVGILDIAQILAGATINMPIKIDKRTGKHTLWIDDFQILAEAIPTPGGKGVVIDSFDRKQLNWYTLGGVEMGVSASGSPLKAPALEAAYQQMADRFCVISRRIRAGSLAGTDRLALDLASDKPAHLVISLEGKKRYNHTLDVTGGREAVHVEIPISEFELDGNTADGEAKLDPAAVKSIAISDVQGMLSGKKQKNILWVANIRAFQ